MKRSLLISAVVALSWMDFVQAGTWTMLDRLGVGSTHPMGIDGGNIVGLAGYQGGPAFLYNGTTGNWTTLEKPDTHDITPMSIDSDNSGMLIGENKFKG